MSDDVGRKVSIVEHAGQPSTRELLTEWRDARLAIFDTPVDKTVTPAQFARLAVAEHRMMDMARKL